MNPDPSAAWTFDPQAERYVSLATFRRDGREVRTPVWVVGLDGPAYVYSAGDAGKVKRLRREPAARMAACSWRGVVHGDWVDVRAQFVTDAQRLRRVFDAFHRKYGWQIGLASVMSRLAGTIDRRVVMAFEPVSWSRVTDPSRT